MNIKVDNALHKIAARWSWNPTHWVESEQASLDRESAEAHQRAEAEMSKQDPGYRAYVESQVTPAKKPTTVEVVETKVNPRTGRRGRIENFGGGEWRTADPRAARRAATQQNGTIDYTTYQNAMAGRAAAIQPAAIQTPAFSYRQQVNERIVQQGRDRAARDAAANAAYSAHTERINKTKEQIAARQGNRRIKPTAYIAAKGVRKGISDNYFGKGAKSITGF